MIEIEFGNAQKIGYKWENDSNCEKRSDFVDIAVIYYAAKMFIHHFQPKKKTEVHFKKVHSRVIYICIFVKASLKTQTKFALNDSYFSSKKGE